MLAPCQCFNYCLVIVERAPVSFVSVFVQSVGGKMQAHCGVFLASIPCIPYIKQVVVTPGSKLKLAAICAPLQATHLLPVTLEGGNVMAGDLRNKRKVRKCPSTTGR